jgi:competence transcription factor ComK
VNMTKMETMFQNYGKKTNLLVDRAPLNLLDDTLKYIGFDLRGAMAGAKFILNKTVKCPIIVNPYQSVCRFLNILSTPKQLATKLR